MASVISYYEEVKAAGRDGTLAKNRQAEASAKSARGKAARARGLESRVRAIIAALDSDGRWITKFRGSDQIRTDTFIGNMSVLADYLEATR